MQLHIFCTYTYTYLFIDFHGFKKSEIKQEHAMSS